MTDSKDARPAARKRLDDAISEYATALNADRPDLLGVGAWIVVIHAPSTEDETNAYVVESAPNQPWHASLGLSRYAQLHYEETDDE